MFLRETILSANGRVLLDNVAASSPMTSVVIFPLFCAVGFVCFISYNLVRMPALSLFAESLGAGPEVIGLVVSVSTMTGVLLKLPMGVLSDVSNRRRLMFVGVLAFALPPFAYPYVSDLNILTTVRLFHGLATAVFTPLALATVAEMYHDQRGAALGWYTSAAQGGSLHGPVLGGWLVYTAGFSPTFVVAGVFGALGLVLFLMIPPSSSPDLRKTQSRREMIEEFRNGLTIVVRHPRMMATSVAEAAKMVANGALMAFLPLYGLSVGLNAVDVGLLFGVQGVTSFLAKPVMGRVSDQFGRQPLIFLGLLICGATIMLIPQASSFLPLVVFAAGFGFGEAVVTSSSAAFIADLSTMKNLGAGMGLRGTIMDVGHASGPLLAGVLIAHVSYLGAFASIGAIQFIAAVYFGLMTVWRRERQAI